MTKASTFILVRHAESDGIHSKLAGRAEGAALTAVGHRQARKLAAAVSQLTPGRIVASPLQRAQETASYVAESCGIAIETDPAFDECDFGDWTGMSFEVLEKAELWKRFNQFRSVSAAPGGESISDVQYRATQALFRLHREQREKPTVIVTHADVIRAALTFFCGTPLDLLLRFAIDPASISIVDLAAYGAVVRCVNRLAL